MAEPGVREWNITLGCAGPCTTYATGEESGSAVHSKTWNFLRPDAGHFLILRYLAWRPFTKLVEYEERNVVASLQQSFFLLLRKKSDSMMGMSMLLHGHHDGWDC